jgi:putative alpha-1,2-mannosidase
LFGEVTIDPDNSRKFIIRALNNSNINKYIQSATLNGKPFPRTWISQKEITEGGTLIFEMGPEPNKKWGTKPDDAPPSMSGK